MSDVIIQLENASYSYGQTPILNNVSLSVQEGEFSCLIGPNGSGKTTFLQLVMGFLRPTSGSIAVYNTTPKEARRYIAYVPQTLDYDRLFPISTLEVVLSGCLYNCPWWHSFYSKKDKEKALELLDKMNLSALKNQAFGSLSGGQAQKTLIARALIKNPKILLLDEPTSCVDIQAEHDILAILKNLQRSMTVLMVTHDLNVVAKNVDKIYSFHGCVEVFSPQDLCEHHLFGLYHTHKKELS